MSTVVVVGSINEDLYLRIPSLPRRGETVLADTALRLPGGKGANQAAAVVRAGQQCLLVGAVGDDEAGRRIRASLSRCGVDVTHVRIMENHPTGVAAVMVDASGDNAIVVSPGANGEVDERQVTASLAEIPHLDTVLAQGELTHACMKAAAATAANRGARFVLNLAPYQLVSAQTLAACDPLVVNEGESAALATDLGIDAADHLLRAQALARHMPSVIITLGAEGAVYASGTVHGHIPAPEVRVVDSTGAGDAFVGAVASTLAHGGTLATACQAGVEYGSRAVQDVGAQTWHTETPGR